MTLVSHDHRFIFLKTRKTAGTATEMALEPFCTPPGHTPRHTTDTLISDHGIVGARVVGQQLDHGKWYAHQPAAKVRKALGRKRFDSYTKLTVLRNPFDKVVSWFHWRRDASGKTLAQETPAQTIRAFNQFVRQAGRSGTLARFAEADWKVCSIGDELVIDWVLRTETMQHDLAYFAQCRGLDFSRLHVPKPKTAARKKDRIAVPEYYGKVTAGIVREHFGWVFEAGDYSERPEDAARATAQPISVMAAE